MTQPQFLQGRLVQAGDLTVNGEQYPGAPNEFLKLCESVIMREMDRDIPPEKNK